MIKPLVLAFLLTTAAAEAQRTSVDGLQIGAELAYRVSRTYSALKKTSVYQALVKPNLSVIQAEVKRRTEEHLRTGIGTPESPYQVNDGSLAFAASSAIEACPKEIKKILNEQNIPKPKRFALDPSTDPMALAQCQYFNERLYSDFVRWNFLRNHPDSAVPAPPSLGVVQVNPLITAKEEEGVLKLSIKSHLGSRGEWFQEILNRSWNAAGTVRIQLDSRADIGALFRIFSAPGELPRASGIAGSSIRMDFGLDQENILIHEFGHILGFADCYVDQWDAQTQTETYYELDRSNILCSLAGSVLPAHLEAIRKAYLR